MWYKNIFLTVIFNNFLMTGRNFKGQVRVSAAEKEFMEKAGLGFSRVFRVGLDTLKLSIQADGSPSCVYLYNIRQNRGSHASALCLSSEPHAQVCPCQVCPIRVAYGTVPHATPKVQKKE